MEIKEFSLVCVRFDSKLIFCFFFKILEILANLPIWKFKTMKIFFRHNPPYLLLKSRLLPTSHLALWLKKWMHCFVFCSKGPF